MNAYHAISLVLTLTGLFAYINARYFKLPTTIGIMTGSMILTIVIFLIGFLGFSDFHLDVYESLLELDFHELVLDGLLSFLLFAGALTINLDDLKNNKWEIFSLATFSTIFSIFLIATSIYYLLPILGLSLSYIHCLLYGALISPTDPIAVLAIFTKIRAPKKLQTIISGESLFNDGFAIVLFLTFYHIAFLGDEPSIANVSILLFEQGFGGVVYGMVLGWVGYQMIKPIDSFKSEVLITVAIAMGGYAGAEDLGVSGPLAMVVAGLIIGNSRRDLQSQNKDSYHELENFWEVVDEILNAILFMLLGLETLLITHHEVHALLIIAVIPLTILVRFISISIPLSIFKQFKQYPNNLLTIVTWGGLRGGLAVALVLSLPPGEYRHLILAMTFPVVIFSVIVQGLTIGKLVQRSKDNA